MRDELANMLAIAGAAAFLIAIAVFMGCVFAWL
jgi:hypothetical protein